MAIRHSRPERSTARPIDDAAPRGRKTVGSPVDPTTAVAPSDEVLRIHQTTLAAMTESLAHLSEPVDRHLLNSVQRVLEVAHDPIHMAILARGIDALTSMTSALDQSEIARILANSSGVEVLLDLVERAPFSDRHVDDDPLRDARVRGLHLREQVLKAEGGTWSAEEVGQHLGISRQGVERRRREDRLLALPVGGRAYRYPRWQFDSEGVLPGFPEILAAFALPGAWTRAAFFLGTNDLLGGRRPLDVLRQGQVGEVMAAAATYGEQVAA
jgi:hypothetical protein